MLWEFFKIKKILQRKKIEKIHLDSEKLINSFEIKQW